MVTKRTAQFCRHRMFDRAMPTIPFIRVRLTFDLVAVLLSTRTVSRIKTACTILCTESDFEMKGMSIWNADVLHVIHLNTGLRLLSVS